MGRRTIERPPCNTLSYPWSFTLLLPFSFADSRSAASASEDGVPDWRERSVMVCMVKWITLEFIETWAYILYSLFIFLHFTQWAIGMPSFTLSLAISVVMDCSSHSIDVIHIPSIWKELLFIVQNGQPTRLQLGALIHCRLDPYVQGNTKIRVSCRWLCKHTIFHESNLLDRKFIKHWNEIRKMPTLLVIIINLHPRKHELERGFELSPVACSECVDILCQKLDHLHEGYPVLRQWGTLKILEESVNEVFHLCIFLQLCMYIRKFPSINLISNVNKMSWWPETLK